MTSRLGVIVGLLALCLSGCGGANPSPTALASPPAPTVALSTSTPASPSGGTGLTLWVPPELTPDPNTPAGALLAERLQAFRDSHPDLTLEVRVKDRSGPAGLVETLSAARVAAPQAVPDLIALDPVNLNTAIVKNLIIPMTDIAQAPSAPDWLPFAIDVSNEDQSYFGLPFASDALAFAYRTDRFDTPPTSWQSLMDAAHLFMLPLADPQASITLAQYQAMRGPLVSDDGQPNLDPTTLAKILAFYASADRTGYLPPSAPQVASAADSWQALRDRRVDAAVVSLQAYLLADNRSNLSVIPLPTQDGKGIAYAYPWSWAVATSDPSRQDQVKELLAFLNQPSFLGPWTEALGMMPPTASALGAWSSDADRAAVQQLADAATVAPGAERTATFGPPLLTAVQTVLVGGGTPDSAALTAAKAVQNP
jgi:ABC-type glycerol-3-phosphate transport system substrate-binding protein